MTMKHISESMQEWLQKLRDDKNTPTEHSEGLGNLVTTIRTVRESKNEDKDES